MKKTLILALAMLTATLCGCSKTHGVIDCCEIKVTNGESELFTGAYSLSYTSVYKYESNDGKSIYTDHRIVVTQNGSGADCEIRAYPNKYTDDYVSYKFSDQVGFLTCEQNYYLDIENRIIDSEIKWSKCKRKAEWPLDNNEAYSCARQNYYQVSPIATSYDLDNGVYYYPVRLDLSESSLERHIYTKFGNDCTISYRAKWF